MKIIGNTYNTRSAIAVAEIAADKGFCVVGLDGGIRYCGLAKYKFSLDGDTKRVCSNAYGVTKSYADIEASRVYNANKRRAKRAGIEFNGGRIGLVQNGFRETSHTRTAAEMVVSAQIDDLGKQPAILCVEMASPPAVTSVNSVWKDSRQEHITGGVQWTFGVTVPKSKKDLTGNKNSSKKVVQLEVARREREAGKTPGTPEKLHRFRTYDESDACAIALSGGAELRSMFISILEGGMCEIGKCLWGYE